MLPVALRRIGFSAKGNLCAGRFCSSDMLRNAGQPQQHQHLASLSSYTLWWAWMDAGVCVQAATTATATHRMPGNYTKLTFINRWSSPFLPLKPLLWSEKLMFWSRITPKLRTGEFWSMQSQSWGRCSFKMSTFLIAVEHQEWPQFYDYVRLA